MDIAEIKDLTQWALDRGAIDVQIGETRFRFLEGYSADTDVPPNMRQYLQNGAESEDSEAPVSNPEGVRRSQDPDEYAHMADQWANYRPLPNR